MELKEIQSYESIDLGCGENKHDGALGVDIVDTDDVDVVMDLNDAPWDLPSRSFSEIYCKDIIEHLDDPLEFLEEVHRIGKDGARVYIRTPHFTNNNAWVDPTHVRPFSALTFTDYITKSGQYSYYTDAEFELESLHIGFTSRKFFVWNIVGSAVANRFPWFYENTVLRSIFPAQSMDIELTVIKER